MDAASSTARRCCSVKKPGMESTQSVIFAPWSRSPIVRSSASSAASSCSGRMVTAERRYCTFTTGTPSGPSSTANEKEGASAASSASPLRLPIIRFRLLIVFFGSMLIFSPAETPRKRCGAGRVRTVPERRAA